MAHENSSQAASFHRFCDLPMWCYCSVLLSQSIRARCQARSSLLIHYKVASYLSLVMSSNFIDTLKGRLPGPFEVNSALFPHFSQDLCLIYCHLTAAIILRGLSVRIRRFGSEVSLAFQSSMFDYCELGAL